MPESATPFDPCKQWLRQTSFLTGDDCDMFEPLLKVRHYPAKSFLLEAGKVPHEMGFVNHGAFRTFYLADGKEVNTHFVFEHEFVTDYNNFLSQTPSRYYIQALEDAEVVSFDLETLRHAYDQSKNWERFGRIMAEHASQLTARRVESFLFMDAEERYRQLQQDAPHFFERIPLYHIASYLGMERESLSRLRRKILEKERM